MLKLVKSLHLCYVNNVAIKRIKSLFSLISLLVVGAVIVILVSQIDTIRTLLTRAKGEPANLIIDTQAVVGQMPRPWRNLAQGGENPDFQITPLQPKLAALHPEYIRIDHLYDFYINVSGDSGNLSFDWSKLDQLLSQMQALGAKPFISLSYTPPAISKGDITDAPRDWNDWALVIQRTIEHISGSSGLNISDVYYEVWNEPDLFGQWKTYGDKNYLTLYNYAALGAARAASVRPFKFGGPAITAFYDAWAKNLFKFVTDNNLRLDFFSWHRYARDIDTYLEDVGKLNLVLEQFPNLVNLEKIITEAGHDSDIDPGFDTMYGAAHTLSLSRSLTGLVNRIFTLEIEDGKDPQGQALWGRWGLFTHPDFGSTAKPRYDALALLEKLSNERLTVTGEGTWVKALAAAVPDTQSTQVLVINYDSAGKHAELVPITFTGLTAPSFTISESFLRGQQRQLPVATTAAELRHDLFMPANSAALVTLTPSP